MKLNNKGFIVLKSVLNKADIQTINKKLVKDKLNRKDRFVLSTPSYIQKLATNEAIIEQAKKFLGDDISLYFIRLLIKDSQWDDSVGAHQDMPYFHGGNKLSIFIPLTAVNKDNGGLFLIEKTHNFGNLGIKGKINYDKKRFKSVCPSLKPGDILITDFYTWHYSEKRKNDIPRNIIQIALQPSYDGSYYHSLKSPTLLTGKWKTKFFSKYGENIQNDHIPPKIINENNQIHKIFSNIYNKLWK